MSITVQGCGSGRQWAQLDLSRFRWKEKAEANDAKVFNCGGRRKNCRNSQAGCIHRTMDWNRIFSLSLRISSATFAIQRLAVSFANEICDSGVGFCHSFFLWQEHDAEVLRARFLAEAGTVHNHHMFLADKFLHKDFVALGNIDSRESIECPARRHAAYTRCRLAPLLRKITTRAQFAPHVHEMVLRAFEGRRDRILLRMVGAEARTQQTVNTFGVRLHRGRFARDHAPPDAPSRNEIILRHTAEGYARKVRRD